ncbi:hypothetical protein GCM10025881_38430 [Pseudolysinimonas kribbensis]|uniref:Primosomal protein N' 3' DNA-binding domain-containing protein n=1 Tax=Pseudolysinimonas kribbensis TaxID=433641 RepID=A0ABQ6K9D7_9MICO|nr:hypothetical protein [Pseudolysinimonas kribbensis]GMA97019.1 hypothetical protein GCM10025881_38430 [Pseudolysinimonas kribbensis]
MSAIARVLVDSSLPQLDRLLDYRVPDGFEVAPGVRVSVPLRSAGRRADGFVVELADQQAFPGPLSDLAAVVSPVPVLRPEVWRLARAVADRAAGSASDVLRHAIPTRQVRVEKAWLARGEEPAAPAIAAPGLPEYPDDLVRALAAHERLALRVPTGVERIGDAWAGRWASVLARLAARTVAAGESAIVVLPDYRDEDQFAAALAPLVPASARVRWDAALSNPERYRGLLRAMEAAPAVVFGTRGRSTRRPPGSGSSWSGTTATRCSASRSRRTCTRGMRP